MLWCEISMLCFEIPMLYYEISVLCYVMVHVVKDMLELIVAYLKSMRSTLVVLFLRTNQPFILEQRGIQTDS